MAEIEEIVSGQRALVNSELWGPNERPAVPNLISSNLDQMAMRVATTTPTPMFEAEKVGKAQAERTARQKADVVRGWWHANRWQSKMAYRARDLIAKGAAPVIIRPGVDLRIPLWQVLDPRRVLPGAQLHRDDPHLSDALFTYDQPISWLQQRWPDQMTRLFKGERYRRDDKLVVAEYWSAEQGMLLVIGARRQYESDQPTEWGFSRFEVLERLENRIGMCPIVMPTRITLHGQSGAFDSVIGIWERQARLMALEEIAVKRGVLSETWFEEREPNGKVITPANAATGQVGHVRGGTLREMRPDPSFAALQIIDRGERSIRVETGSPSEWGGEAATNVQTARRGNAILSATTDFRIHEYQQTFERSFECEIEVATAIDRAFFGDHPKVVNVAWEGSKSAPTYEPKKLWEHVAVQVRYSFPGADLNGQVIRVGQMLGMGLISQQTSRELLPDIENPELEKDRSTAEQLEAAFFSALQEKAAAGEIPLTALARFQREVKTDKAEWWEVWERIQEEAQRQQSPNLDPVAPGDPAAMPGLEPPGTVEAGAAPAHDSSLEGLLARLGDQTRLSGAMRLGQRASAGEQMAEASAAVA